MRVFFILLIAGFLLFSGGSFYHHSYAQDAAVKTEKSSDSKGDITQKGSEEAEKAPGEGFEEDDFRPQVEEESMGWLMIRSIFVLGLLALGFYMFVRFIQQKSGIQISGQSVIQVLSVSPLGPGKTLHVVDMAGKVFLLGVSENNINLLIEIKDKDEIDRIRLLSSRSAPASGKGFQDMLTEQIGKAFTLINRKKEDKGKSYKMEEMSGDDFDVSYLSSQKNRLKKMNGSHED
jgi:flagellar protein FliO/FliZ